MLEKLLNSKLRHTATVLHRTQKNLNGVAGPVVWEAGKKFPCTFWRHSAAWMEHNAQFRPNILAVIIAQPRDVSPNDIPFGCKIQITNPSGATAGMFSVVYAEDVGQQGQVIEITAREYA